VVSREWKPGDVALVRLSTRAKEEFAIFDGDVWTVRRGLTAEPVDEPRPLVVIDLSEQPASTDPAGRTEAHHLIDMLRETAENFFVPDAAALARKVADQIEEQVGARVTKPAEPMGLGAVVEDAIGDLWFRMAIKNHTWAGEVWQRQHNSGDRWSTWDTIAAVRVLSEGVTQ